MRHGYFGMGIWRVVLLLALFFPLVHNEETRYPLEMEGAQSVSVLLRVWGTTCGEVGLKIIGGHGTQDAKLYLWCECEQMFFYLQTGFYWTDYVCSGDQFIEVTTP
jgi:hypothetical protein